jgi:hypothetical protein
MLRKFLKKIIKMTTFTTKVRDFDVESVALLSCKKNVKCRIYRRKTIFMFLKQK